MLTRSITVLLFAAAAQAQNYPPPFPREGAKKVFENERVAVWDVVWPKGQPSPVHEHRYDQVSVTLVGGAVRVTRLDGSSTVNHSELGSVTLTTKGTVHREEGLSDTPQHKIMIEMKTAGTAVPGREGIPDAFPRDGAVKVMENERVIAWDYTWKPGQAVPIHAYYHDTVTVFVEGGTFAGPAGERNSAAGRAAGQAIYTAASGEARREEAVRGMPRAVILELK
jgi:quercetin dioxygenase-like cupin family protein